MSGGGLLHAASLLLSLASHVVVAMVIGYKSICYMQLPLLLPAATILLVKLLVDKEFRKSLPFPQKVTHCLLAAVFPMSLVHRPAPRTGETEQPEEEGDTMTVRRKLTAQEIGFKFSLQVLNVVVGVVIFTVLSWTDQHYGEAVRKVSEASGISLSLLIYVLCPTATVLSIALRTAASFKSPWKAARLPDGPFQNTCRCSPNACFCPDSSCCCANGCCVLAFSCGCPDDSCWAKSCQWWPPIPRTRSVSRSIPITVTRLPGNVPEEVNTLLEQIQDNRAGSS